MTLQQPQLLQIPLDTKDVVYTPRWVARDMVEYFKPSGRILEPCKGDGVFLEFMPGAEWCEIQEGRDFFAWTEHVDWCVGNPPYTVYSKFLNHSMEVADNILYLVPCNKAFNSYRMITEMFDWGGIVEMRVYGGGAAVNFPIGFAVGAVHYKRGYTGDMRITLYEEVGK